MRTVGKVAHVPKVMNEEQIVQNPDAGWDALALRGSMLSVVSRRRSFIWMVGIIRVESQTSWTSGRRRSWTLRSNSTFQWTAISS